MTSPAKAEIVPKTRSHHPNRGAELKSESPAEPISEPGAEVKSESGAEVLRNPHANHLYALALPALVILGCAAAPLTNREV